MGDLTIEVRVILLIAAGLGFMLQVDNLMEAIAAWKAEKGGDDTPDEGDAAAP